MNNQIQMCLGNLNLKIEGTQFLAHHVWSMYSKEMRALHEIARLFLADYNKNERVNIRYNGLANTSTGVTNEAYEMVVGNDTVARICFYSCKEEPSKIELEEYSMADLVKLYDVFAKYSHGGLYGSDKTEMTAQTMLHPLRALVTNMLTAGSTNKLTGHIEDTTRDRKRFTAVINMPDSGEQKQMVAIELLSPEMEEVAA